MRTGATIGLASGPLEAGWQRAGKGGAAVGGWPEEEGGGAAVEELRGPRPATELQRAKSGRRHLNARWRRRAVQGEAKASQRWFRAGSRGAETRPRVSQRCGRAMATWGERHSVVEAEVEEASAEVQVELRSEVETATPRARLARRAVEVAVRFASGFCPPME